MTSLANDFTSGVRLASDLKQRSHSRGLMDRNMKMREESHGANMSLNGINQQVAGERLSGLEFANSDGQRKYVTDTQQGQLEANKFALGESKKTANHSQWQRGNEKEDRVEVEKNKTMVTALEQLKMRDAQGVKMTPEYMREIAPAFDGTIFDMGKFTQKGFMDDIEALSGYMNPNNRDKAGNDPAVIPLLNRIYKSEINQGGGVHPESGSPVTNKEIVAVRPDPNNKGRYIPSLKVTYADGSVRNDLPMTKGRDDKGEKVSSVHLGDLIDQVEVMKQFGKLTAPWVGAVRDYGKKGYDHKGKGAFNGFGQTNLNEETFTKKYNQEYTLEDPVNGKVSFVDYGDVRKAENNPKKLAELEQIAGINRRVHAENLTLDADEQRPFLSLTDYRNMQADAKRNEVSANKVKLNSSSKKQPAQGEQPKAGLAQLSEEEQFEQDIDAVQNPVSTAISNGLQSVSDWATKDRSKPKEEPEHSSTLRVGSKAHSRAKSREATKLHEEHSRLTRLYKSKKITPEQKQRLKELTNQLNK
jgi:hypothetical protein